MSAEFDFLVLKLKVTYFLLYFCHWTLNKLSIFHEGAFFICVY